MILDFSTLSESKKYSVMSNTIFPRPIAWISTEDNGVVNLAPFSCFTPLSSEPPLVIENVKPEEDIKKVERKLASEKKKILGSKDSLK